MPAPFVKTWKVKDHSTRVGTEVVGLFDEEV
jgi:hypothetical protein